MKKEHRPKKKNLSRGIALALVAAAVLQMVSVARSGSKPGARK